MKNALFCLAVLILVTACEKVEPGNSSSDLDEYISQTRADKMSEFAKSTLGTVAAIHLGQSTLEYLRRGDDVRYWASYRSNTCPSPVATKDDRKAQAEQLEAKRAIIMPAIIIAADSDSSGFVSSSEARWFRKIYEFGHEYTFVIEVLAGDWSQYGGNSDMTELDLREWVEEYNKIARRVVDGGGQMMVPIEISSD